MDLTIREANDDDATAFARFTCSTGEWYEEEVQDYIREKAISHARQKLRYLLLAVHENSRLVAVMAHADEAVIFPEGETWIAARLQLLAIARDDQGRKLPGFGRLSDVLFATLISDAMAHQGTDLITAIVAAENVRSLAMCERNGLRSQIRHGTDHVRLTARMRSR